MSLPKYSIRTLLLLTTGLGCLLAGVLWLTKDYRERRQAEGQLRDQGAVYAFVDKDRLASVVFNQPITSADFAKLKSLHRVELKGFAVDRQTLEQLSRLEQIDSLMLQTCTLTDSDDLQLLQNIAGLKTLIFWNTPITDESVDVLSNMRGLDLISLSNTNMTATGIKKLSEANPHLKVFSRP